MKSETYIHSLPSVLLGKPVFRDTRLGVEHVLRELSLGATTAELMEAYPQLTPAHIQAALLYAAELVSLETTTAA